MRTSDLNGLTYESADRMIGGASERKVCNNTVLRRIAGGRIAMTLHDTDVAILGPDGSVTLNTGGFQTLTTKDRMTRIEGVWIAQKAKKWVIFAGGTVRGKAYPFKDGVAVGADGSIRMPA